MTGKAAPGKAVTGKAAPKTFPPSAEPGHFPSLGHDHAACQAHLLNQAELTSTASGARLTPMRRRVLELLLEDHRPLSAYDILNRLNTGREAAHSGRPLAPPTVYRALDFLVAHGLAHRLNSRNAFVGCAHPGEQHAAHFLICIHCGVVLEITQPAITEGIAQAAKDAGFTVTASTIEIEGCCPHCAKAQTPQSTNPLG